jgi:hypothetical protein
VILVVIDALVSVITPLKLCIFTFSASGEIVVALDPVVDPALTLEVEVVRAVSSARFTVTADSELKIGTRTPSVSRAITTSWVVPLSGLAIVVLCVSPFTGVIAITESTSTEFELAITIVSLDSIGTFRTADSVEA